MTTTTTPAKATTATATLLHSHNYNSTLIERLLFRVAKKWVAGYSIDDAIAAARDANRRGMSAILNFLGEDIVDSSQVELTIKEYILLMRTIKEKGIRGCVSIKPTQLGLAISYDLCLQNFRSLSNIAKDLDQFMWIDMESMKFVEDTITIYLELLKENPMIGVAIQAYLRRSGADVLHILEHKGKVRLVKGAYHEQEEDAFTTREDIDNNYVHLLKLIAEGGEEEGGEAAFIAVATHDDKLIRQAFNILLNGRRKNYFEFQMLMGVRNELKSQLVSMDMPVSEYIPYGSHWLPYSVRRIRERKRNLLLLARSLVQS